MRLRSASRVALGALWIGILAMMSGAAGCSRSNPTPAATADTAATQPAATQPEQSPPPAKSETPPAVAPARAQAADPAPPSPPTPDAANRPDAASSPEGRALAEALDALAGCALTPRGLTSECVPLAAFREAQRAQAGSEIPPAELSAELTQLVQSRLNAESPAIRWATGQLASGALLADNAVELAVIGAMATEPDPVVLAVLVDALGARIGESEGARQGIIDASRHESATVRAASVAWLTSPLARKADGTLMRLVEMLRDDPDFGVRAAVCRSAHRREDESLVPLVSRFVSAGSAQAEESRLYDACWEGLVRFWVGYPQPARPSAKAFALTLEHLNQTPRTERRPGAEALRQMRAVDDAAWQKRAAFFDAAALASALVATASDPDCGWMTRVAAAEALAATDATDEQWISIRASAAADDFATTQVRQALDRLRPATGLPPTPTEP